MAELRTFLEKCYADLNQWRSLREIYIVLGNESCDLDSAVSAIAYGFLLFKKNELENSMNQTVFPVLNVDRKHFPMRLEHCYLMNQLDINLEKLIFRSDINFEELIEAVNDMKITVKTYLVDHHVLSRNDDILRQTVCRIFDHRTLDEKNFCPGELRIEPVGSCATIISDEIFKEDFEIWNKDIAYLVYCTILMDTKGLRPKKGKTTALDMEIASKLERKFGFNKSNLYDKLKDLRCSTCHLTIDEMLIKDLKCSGSIAFSRIHVLAETFIAKDCAMDSLKEFCSKKKVSMIILIGSEANSKMKDMGLFFDTNNERFIRKFCQKLRENGMRDLPNILENFVVFKFEFQKLTRKEIIPIILNIYEELKTELTSH
ncbi:hypothetical protein HHI36_021308 [Cryptolaemus montrouzieri]|uniref:Uncharacterized protein n=1 Tax=Cryptolaemus montrouzieri TaxID=559131 RepID=A0ABD2MXQ3_9CUCU